MSSNTDQSRRYADRLNEELRETLESLQRIEQEIPELSQGDDEEGGVPANHMADQGSDVYEMERLGSFRAELNDHLQLIRAAQDRLADGTYGTCQRCGKEINPERLEALPWAAYCIECQEIIDEQGDPDAANEAATGNPRARDGA